jgi:hypothetical protein
MNSSHRREEKKRRRQKRLAKRHEPVRAVEDIINELAELNAVPLPSSFPGACHPTLERPDRIKHEIAAYADRGSGREELRRFERQMQLGILGDFPNIVDWCLEEFIWHGAPGVNWNPVDRFLSASTDRFPPNALEQLARWKQAQLGFYEVGDCADDLVALRELDPVTLNPAKSWMHAISLNIGGVNFYKKQKGLINFTYLAPWAPEQNIHCAMGYGLALPRSSCAPAVPLILGMENVEALVSPLPWNSGNIAKQHFFEEWRRRDWSAWMREHVRLPFMAAVLFGPTDSRIVRIDDMITRTAEEAQRLGIYFGAWMANKEAGVLGATAITPIEVDSPNALAFAEYQEYRRHVGPPPATRGW